MIKVYIANDPVHAHLLEEILESNGIQAVVRDEQAFNLRGELPVVYPSLWTSEESAVAARRICVDFDHLKKDAGKQGSWVCPECGETISAEFTDCWKCAKQDKDMSAALELIERAQPSTGAKILRWTILILLILSVLAELLTLMAGH